MSFDDFFLGSPLIRTGLEDFATQPQRRRSQVVKRRIPKHAKKAAKSTLFFIQKHQSLMQVLTQKCKVEGCGKDAVKAYTQDNFHDAKDGGTIKDLAIKILICKDHAYEIAHSSDWHCEINDF